MGNGKDYRPDGIERVTNGALTALVAVALIAGVLPAIVSQILGLGDIESLKGWDGLTAFQSFMYLVPTVMGIGAIAVIIRLFTSSRE